MPNNWIVDDIHELANDILLQSQGGDVFPDMSGYVGVYNTGNGLLAFASGNPVTISNAKNENAVNVTATLEPIQSGSGTPSPTNVRPITGRTQVDVTRTGKNLINFKSLLDTWGSRYTDMGDGSYNVTSTGSGYREPIRFASKDIDATLSGVITLLSGSAGWRIQMLNSNNEVVATLGAGSTTVSGKGCKLRLNYITAGAGANYKNIQVELGSSFTSYEEYTGKSVTVNLGQTVYGGTLDVTTGLLTVKTANIASYSGESIGEPWWSSMDEYVAGTTPTTGAQVVYTLATPTTVSLTPAQIQLLTTTNIISTSADDLEVTYKIRS